MVDSENSLSGDFYIIYGYAPNKIKKDYSGEYSPVMIAVCMKCQDEIKTGKISVLG